MNPDFRPRYEVMARIRTVRGVRGFFASPITNSAFGIGLLACMSILVSIGDVFTNTMAHVNWGERISYAFSSFAHTRFVVQTLGALIISTSCIALINFTRKLPFRKIGILFGSTQQV